MNKIVTISREFGSGGREMGRRLAEELSCVYYDQEIISEIARRTKLAEDYVQQIIESKPAFSFPINIGVTFQISSNELGKQKAIVFQEQCNLLKELAEKSDCVIVGRCADYILSDYNPYRIFVYANMESKTERCRRKGKQDREMSEKELKRCILEVDKRRAEYYGFITGQSWGRKHNYDLCVNTTNISIKEVTPYISQMLMGMIWNSERYN